MIVKINNSGSHMLLKVITITTMVSILIVGFSMSLAEIIMTGCF